MMAKETVRRVMMPTIALIMIMNGKEAMALCLKNCRTEGSRSSTLTPSISYQRSESRENSHNMRDVRNSIVGNVTIQNGHEKLEIGNVTAERSVIDASINSTVILGDMKQ